MAGAFPWARGSRFVHMRDNHTSVLGVREAALAAGAAVTAVDPRRSPAGLSQPLGHCQTCQVCSQDQGVLHATHAEGHGLTLSASPCSNLACALSARRPWVAWVARQATLTLLDRACLVAVAVAHDEQFSYNTRKSDYCI